MKVHVFNLLLLVIVGGCLFITLSGSAPEAKPVSSLHQAFVTVAPSPSPHPVDVYRQDRNRQRSENLQALEGLLTGPGEQLQQTARQALLSQSAAAEMETKVEGMLAGMGYERSVCVYQTDSISLFLCPTASPEHIPLLLQSAADICRVPKEKVQLLVP